MPKKLNLLKNKPRNIIVQTWIPESHADFQSPEYIFYAIKSSDIPYLGLSLFRKASESQSSYYYITFNATSDQSVVLEYVVSAAYNRK